MRAYVFAGSEAIGRLLPGSLGRLFTNPAAQSRSPAGTSLEDEWCESSAEARPEVHAEGLWRALAGTSQKGDADRCCLRELPHGGEERRATPRSGPLACRSRCEALELAVESQ